MSEQPFARARAVYEGTEGTVSIHDGILQFEHAGGVVGDVPVAELTGYQRRRFKIGFTVQHGDRSLTFDLLTPLVAEKKERGPRPDQPVDEITPIVSVLDSSCRSMAKAYRRNFERLLPHASPT